MALKSQTWFISDLHLKEKQPALTNRFFALLQHNVSQIDALYILGDFFESWVGDDDQSDFISEIKSTLRHATNRGLPIYFMHGNRDFLVGKKFFQETGCQFIPDETVIDLYGTPVLLMHGDTLCTLDVNYQKTRKHLRNPIVQKIFLWLPLAFRKKIADKMRTSSMKYVQTANAEIMDVTQLAVQSVMQKHKVQHLIHGHTHQPAIHVFQLNGKTYERIVLSDWHDKDHALIWKSSGEKECF